MARCGCAGGSCSCVIEGSGAITVSGSGSAVDPYQVSGGGVINVTDSPTIDLSLVGSGSDADPYQLSAAATVSLDEILDVDASVMTEGYVLARQADGTFTMMPPATATPGLVTHDTSLFGDGSTGNPVGVSRAWLDSYFGSNGGNLSGLYATTTQIATLQEQMSQFQLSLQSLQSRMQYLPYRVAVGTVGINPVPNVVTSAPVQFPSGYFTNAPFVWTQAYTTTPGAVDYTSYQNVTPDGCNVYIMRSNSTATSIKWLAIQMNQ